MATAIEKLTLAKKHLQKVQGAWDPPDWADLSLYGFYCIEAAVDAAAIHYKLQVQPQHSHRVNTAKGLHSAHGLPDVADLLIELNNVRKREAYGDIDAPELDAEDVASLIEEYVDVVSKLLKSEGEKGK